MAERLSQDELDQLPFIRCPDCDLRIHIDVEAIRADEREQIALAWQIKDWPIITKSVKAGSVIGAAQVVTDWLRGRAWDSNGA